MKLIEAFKKVYIEEIFTVKTRASRMEYWGSELIALPGMFVVAFISYLLSFGLGDLISNILTAWSVVATITVSIRRMHDVGKSGWNVLWGVIPLGGLYVLYLNLQPSETGINIWGQQPEHTKIN